MSGHAARRRFLCRVSAAGLHLAACIVALWLAVAVAAADGPFKLRDEVGKLAATFPAEPSLEKAEGEHLHYTWSVILDERHFYLNFTEYRTPPAKNYDKNVMQMLKATKGKLVSQARVDAGDVDGREVVSWLPDKNMVMRQRLFQVGNRLYQAVYIGPFGTETRADVETFMTTFEILK